MKTTATKVLTSTGSARLVSQTWVDASIKSYAAHLQAGKVIVKLSANRKYGTTPDEAENREEETLEFLRAVASQLDV